MATGTEHEDAPARTPILVVDDDARNLLVVEAVLEGTGIDIVKARSGREALQLLAERTFPVIVLDVHMPELDGFETAKRIRADERTRHVPIIFLTANDDVRRAAMGYAHGAVDYLFKPVVPEVLRAKVSVFVELHHLKEREKAQRVQEELHRWEAESLRARLDQERAAAEALSSANHWLERALEQAKHALTARERVLQIASHELKTPLTAMRLTVDNAVRRTRSLPEASAGKVTHALHVMGAQVERLSKLVEELLGVVAIDAGRMQVTPATVDLGDLVRCVIDELQYSIEAAGCDVSLTTATVPVKADPFWLQQAIGNLVNNAIKYGAGKPVEVQVGADAQAARVVVRDHGIGIAPSDQARIFQPFERAVTTGSFAGLGLGLYIVQRIVDAHGGRIAVESTPGAGATFTLQLPAAS